jgi:hypothetical protein
MQIFHLLILNDFLYAAAYSKCKYTAKWQEKKPTLEAEYDITDDAIICTRAGRPTLFSLCSKL